MGGNSKRVAAWLTVALIASFSIGVVAPASASEREARDAIFIDSNWDFVDANGVRSGSGTAADPFVISGWDVSDIFIRDTSAHFVIKDNTIDFLTLNWNGDRVRVVNNDIGDLRVNENVKRTGGPTTGFIGYNKIGVVSQIRHFDGTFAHNTVGAPSDMDVPFFTDNRAVNFDGFHGAHFFDNVLYGYLEVRLHGHHHGSSYGSQSHYHGTPVKDEHADHAGADHADDHAPMVDHTQRYHQVFVHNNTIHAAGPYSLIYTDTNHAGNDRTAASERNEELNKAHTHYTKIHLTGNKLIGGGLYVDIFNAKDERHTETNTGLVEIANNDITLVRDSQTLPFEARDGINIWQVKDLKLRIVGNSVTYDGGEDPLAPAGFDSGDAGIRLYNVDMANVLISDNVLAGTYYGVAASQMTKSVYWTISGLVTKGVPEPVHYDTSVKNEPQSGP